MKNRKTTFRYFTICEWEQEQEYLRAMHRQGWKFVGVHFPGFYQFERCEPEDVVYQLDYNPKDSAQPEYIQMFRDCGWEYLTEFVGYTYFRKPVCEMHGDEQIFCDDVSRMQMLKRVFRGRMIPLLIILFSCIIPQIVLNFVENRAIVAVFIVLFVLYLFVFIQFAVTYWKIKK